MLKADPSKSIHAEIYIPGDKSISHRAVILGSLCEGSLEISHFLESEDCLHSLRAMQQLGVQIERRQDKLTVQGVGLGGLKPSVEPIQCGNAGTLMRLIAGILVGQPFDSVLIGDASLSARPMDRIIEPLTLMGAQIVANEQRGKKYAPLKIIGNPKLKAIHYKMPVASAQVKSALLLATFYASGTSEIDEGSPSRDHTERMLRFLGAQLEDSRGVIKFKSQNLKPKAIEIPGDISSAAFFMVAATLIKGSHLILKHVGLNPTRLGVVHILKKMGANIIIHPKAGFEPVGDIEIKSAPLKGIEIPSPWIVSAIDEFPVLFVAASFAKGQTILRGASELRVKEVDRIEVMAKNLAQCGVEVQTFEDGMAVTGGDFQGGKIASMGDHRVAMAFAIAGCCAKIPVWVDDYECINTSFPSFIELAKQCGLELTMENKK